MSLKQGDDIINNARKAAEFLNNAYINVVENTAGKKPLSFLDKDNVTSSTEGLQQFLEGFTDVSTITIFKNLQQGEGHFGMSFTKLE